MKRRRYWRLIMDEKYRLGNQTHFDFKYNGGPARDSMSLLDATDLHGEKRGIETMAWVGLMMPGFYLAFLGIVAAVLLYLGRLAYT
jgi:hypothetical protein